MRIKAKIGIIILAAGNSSRLGSAKQLLALNGKNLLQHTIDEASQIDAHTVYLVLGAFAEEIKNKIKCNNLNLVINEKWSEGLSSSIAFGLQLMLNEYKEIEAVIFLLCDQPFFSNSVLKDIVKKYNKTGKQIIHCKYNNGFGPPTLFHKSLFPDLLELNGSEGAKNIVKQHMEDVAFVDFPKGNIDIDTLEDYEKFVAMP